MISINLHQGAYIHTQFTLVFMFCHSLFSIHTPTEHELQ
ncbi:hypothetical protein SPWS13_0742 [Shewanella putrefaciens]|nr:hypothetical protein SPWS13_0742 [Shewanella putrefaciens]